MPDKPEKPSVTLPATVEKMIKSRVLLGAHTVHEDNQHIMKSWIALAVTVVLGCLIFVLYEAVAHPAHSTAPKTQPLHDTR